MKFNAQYKRLIARGMLFAFLANSLVLPPAYGLNGPTQGLSLPAPGARVPLSPAFNPPVLKGLKVDPTNPLRFEFILDKGDSQLNEDQLKDQSTQLIKYFLTSLTVPEKDLWVNLSPYEKDRIIPESFGMTEMGRDLLTQDYMLKQITASLIYPEDEIGKRFWKRVYEEAAKKFHTTNVPVNTFNKVWIVPEKAVVYENAQAGAAYVVESRLKVMLEQDYLALNKSTQGPSSTADVNALGSQIVREIVIPELTNEVNSGKNFAQLRQVYQSLILAAWYKKKIKDSILNQAYADKNKVTGLLDLSSPNALVGDPENIYQRYLKAFKKGVYNYIKEEQSPLTQELTPRKYFSGGMLLADKAMMVAMEITSNAKGLANDKEELLLTVDMAMADEDLLNSSDSAQVATAIKELRKYVLTTSRNISWSKKGIFYDMSTPWRKARRNAGIPYASVTVPFDEQRFHFIKPVRKLDWDFDDKEIFWEGRFGKREIAFVEQKWPFAFNHFLIVPQRQERRPQVLERQDIELAIDLIGEKPFKAFRIGFNSLTAGASVNHFHMQGFQLPEAQSPLEMATLHKKRDVGKVQVSFVQDYPARAVFFSGAKQELIDVVYRYIHYLQRTEVAHSVVFTPKGIYVLPQKTNHVTQFGNSWTFYELTGLIANERGLKMTEEIITKTIAEVTLAEHEFKASFNEAFGTRAGGIGRYHAEQMEYKPLIRRVTEDDGKGHITLRKEFTALLGQANENEMHIKVLNESPLATILNLQRAKRQSAWTTIETQNECPLCGLLHNEYGHQLGVGNGFVVVPEKFPYFNRTGTIVQMDHQTPSLDRGLVESMTQMLYELGPFGFRVGYNHEGVGQKIKHQSYKVFQRETPIENAPTSALLKFPDINVSVVHNFPTKAFLLETKHLDVLVNELIRMEEFLKLLKISFNILLTLRNDGTIRAFVMLRSGKVSTIFPNKIFGFVESAGIILFEKEEDFNDPELRDKLLAAYKENTVPDFEMNRAVYAYKMHMALGRLALNHHLEYEIDTTGNTSFVCRIEGAGEVVKAMKLDFSPKGQRDWKWHMMFQDGFDIARKYLNEIIAPIQGVDINEQGIFIPVKEDPDYLIQKIVSGESADDQIKELVKTGKPNIAAIMKVYESVITFRSELARRGFMDIDFIKYLINLRGDGKQGFDTSHIRNIFTTNVFGENGYAEQFEENFNEHISVMEKRYPKLGKALRARFGSFSWAKELVRRNIKLPSAATDVKEMPMPEWSSRIVELSKTSKAMVAKAEVFGENKQLVDEIKGGIDFKSEMLGLQVQNSGKEINFQVDPAMLQEFQNSSGIVPVIRNVQPLGDVFTFLEISTKG